ncbi:MAG TPA: PspC domain-containing protein [Roseiflexaceae bacterium]|nr:PspC domain-containing protein [Roseiflexaceae bacterium]HMP40384.1 PspC domain-containing protein [Roseiflexaceae bacterium]
MEVRRLYRSRSGRVIAGVAGGLAAYLRVDPLFVRLALAVLSLVNGIGVLLYLIFWLLVPNEDSTAADAPSQVRENVEEMQNLARSAAERVRAAFTAQVQ